eukprot:CAMPEP_0204520538 /NCGR_PEP_ID=MMETSP0661-20131031/5319_1 /ASSEMBLY_ACC=CAM_ASM_000606 /TAXON_ID=109239 /ORGANISM="Alexandrium margalefi, Strain AMGDE01CS-322" /LENGTH=37 /DNA_ID= /DNA_START= /DNA_END= /DNA_ORIENTATION=
MTGMASTGILPVLSTDSVALMGMPARGPLLNLELMLS